MARIDIRPVYLRIIIWPVRVVWIVISIADPIVVPATPAIAPRVRIIPRTVYRIIWIIRRC